MSIALSQVELIINIGAICGIIYHIGKKEGEILQKVDKECDNLDAKVSALRLDYAKLISQSNQLKISIKDREDILKREIEITRQQDRKDFSIGQENDDRRIRKCCATVSQIEKQLQDKQIYLKLDRNTHF